MNDTFDKTKPLFHQYNSEISNQYISREIKSTLSKLETIKQEQFCIEKSSYLRNTENLEKLVVEE